MQSFNLVDDETLNNLNCQIVTLTLNPHDPLSEQDKILSSK